MIDTEPSKIKVVNMGTTSYKEVWDLQKKLQKKRQNGNKQKA